MRDVCRILGISRPTLRKLVNDGEIKKTTVGNQIRFELQEIQRFVRSEHVGHAQ